MPGLVHYVSPPATLHSSTVCSSFLYSINHAASLKLRLICFVHMIHSRFGYWASVGDIASRVFHLAEGEGTSLIQRAFVWSCTVVTRSQRSKAISRLGQNTNRVQMLDTTCFKPTLALQLWLFAEIFPGPVRPAARFNRTITRPSRSSTIKTFRTWKNESVHLCFKSFVGDVNKE